MQVSEAELEQWVIDNLEEVCGPGVALVGSQIVLPCGSRLDVLGVRKTRDHTAFYVIEIKAGKADPDAVAQVARYMSSLSAAIKTGGGIEPDGNWDITGIVAAPLIAEDVVNLLYWSYDIRWVRLYAEISIDESGSGSPFALYWRQDTKPYEAAVALRDSLVSIAAMNMINDDGPGEDEPGDPSEPPQEVTGVAGGLSEQSISAGLEG